MDDNLPDKLQVIVEPVADHRFGLAGKGCTDCGREAEKRGEREQQGCGGDRVACGLRRLDRLTATETALRD